MTSFTGIGCGRRSAALKTCGERAVRRAHKSGKRWRRSVAGRNKPLALCLKPPLLRADSSPLTAQKDESSVIAIKVRDRSAEREAGIKRMAPFPVVSEVFQVHPEYGRRFSGLASSHNPLRCSPA
ncbi:hypothetical protein AAFF_G00123290 [Aldrovandia affinis]|uniref:Uncharacterized protein n=1 Tax=Aldrovandia affinis TaxID=143900 RepID=A0AAD7RRK9_9TELE|nr:hypothetical protein AAFF_G00123290 [Aldrovandia affinis]